jgi:hypothetical protein
MISIQTGRKMSITDASFTLKACMTAQAENPTKQGQLAKATVVYVHDARLIGCLPHEARSDLPINTGPR